MQQTKKVSQGTRSQDTAVRDHTNLSVGVKQLETSFACRHTLGNVAGMHGYCAML